MKTANRTLFVADAEEVLKRLDDAQFSMVYLDPPWNTRTADAFDREESHDHLASENRTAAHEALIGTVIQQCHRLLTDDGALYFHAPSVSATNFRLILDQVFQKGPSLTIVWKRRGPAGVHKFERSNHDEILRYTKSNQAICNPLRKPSESTLFHLTDERGAYRLVDLTVAGDRALYQFFLGAKGPPVGRSWRFSSARMAELEAEGRIIISASGTPRLKQYWDEQMEGAWIGSVWDDIPPAAARGIHYPAAKPTELVKRLVLQGSNPGCRILDPFAGSGQLLAQADLFGRHWTGVDTSADALSAIRENLETTCGVAGDALSVIGADQVAAMEPVAAKAQTILLNVRELIQATARLARLTTILADLKNFMASEVSDPDELLDIIAQNLPKISLLISPSAKAECLRRLANEHISFTVMELESQDFMVTATYLFTMLGDTFDFSPVSVSAWKALENELVVKLFAPFREWFRTQGVAAKAAVSNDRVKDGEYLNNFLLRRKHMTIGQMWWILDALTDERMRAQWPALGFLSAFSGSHFATPNFLFHRDGLTRVFTMAKIAGYRNGGAHTSRFDKAEAEESMNVAKEIILELIRGLEEAQPA